MVTRTANHFLFEVIVDNGFKGTRFVLKHNEIYPSLHFHSRYVTQALRGKSSVIISGFKVTIIPEKKIHHYHQGMPPAMKTLRDKNRRYGQSHVKPIIGRVNLGRFAGLEFAFFGSHDIADFFSQGVVSLAMNGKIPQHKGCSFRISSHKEAIPLHGNFTTEVEDDLRQYQFVVKPLVAIPLRGRYQGIEYPLLSANQVNQFFTSSMARGVATGHKTSYKGFTFKNVNYEDVKGNTHKLTQQIIDETADALKVPCIAEIVKGEFAGYQFGIIYKSVMAQHFTLRTVQAVLRGDRERYKGCVFMPATYKEAKALTHHLTPEIIEVINQKSRS